MDRREFLKKAGLGAAVLGIGACAPRVLGDDDAKSRAVPDGKMASHRRYAGQTSDFCR